MTVHKSEKADLRVRYRLYLELGIILALLLLIWLFNADFTSEKTLNLTVAEQEVVEMQDIVQTQQDQKPPPPPRPPVPVEVPNDEILEDADLDLDASLDVDATPLDLPPPPPPPPPTQIETVEEPEPEIFVRVEQMPCLLDERGNCDLSLGYPEQNTAGWQFLQSRMKYPEMAKKAEVQGRVTVQFVVGEDGRVSNVEVIRGIGAGCDEVAVSAVESSRFLPGKQRGKPVKVRMSLPFVFRLKER